MSRKISRIGVGIAATALVFGATFAVAGSAFAAEPEPTPTPTPSDPPAQADPLIESTTTTFAAGNWGAGITATGSGFVGVPEGTKLTFLALSGPLDEGDGPQSDFESLATGGMSALADGPEAVLYGQTPVVADASGDFSVTNWVPENLATPLPAGNVAFMAVLLDEDGDLTTTADNITGVLGPELTITPFVPLAQSITITPICSSPEGAFTDGIDVVATGFGQGEAVTDSTGAADGSAVGDVANGTADLTGTYTGHFTLLTEGSDGTNSPIAAGNYNETVTGANGLVLTTSFTVGDCTVPAAVVTTPALANTGSGDAGILIGGSALLLLAGGALVVARRRTAAAK
jgi:LPXTG-motif cell wall-anchored protein